MKYFFIGMVCLFGIIGFLGWLKKGGREESIQEEIVQEISLPISPRREEPLPVKAPDIQPISNTSSRKIASSEDLPKADRIQQLFSLDSSKLPIVETVSYTSRTPWLKGRPAWISDYASHYSTSRHFIARSLNRKADYLTQKVSPGDRFNVFKRDKNIRFHLLIDLSRCSLWLYYLDLDSQERVLLKTYRVGIGRVDAQKTSGYLTPVGQYALGEKIAIYKPGTIGFFQDKKTEMIKVFGTRWIPFESELADCSEPAKGLGLHGTPWFVDPQNGQLIEDRNKIGKYDSDGCIRLLSEDIEEIFSIIITKPTTVELVNDFHSAKLPGHENSSLMRIAQ